MYIYIHIYNRKSLAALSCRMHAFFLYFFFFRKDALLLCVTAFLCFCLSLTVFFSSFFKPSHFSYGVHEKEPHEGKGVVSLSAIDQTFASTASTSRFGVVFREKKKRFLGFLNST